MTAAHAVPQHHDIIREHKEGRVQVVGVDYNTTKMYIIQETQTALVMYVGSRTYWARIGVRDYASPQLVVFNKITDWSEVDLSKTWVRSIEVQKVVTINLERGYHQNIITYNGRKKLK